MPKKLHPLEQLRDLYQSRRFSVKNIVLMIVGSTVSLQTITVAILQIVSVVRRKRRVGRFSHPYLHEVRVGDNRLQQLYNYGRDLFDAMLTAIDSRRKAFTWKPTSGKATRLVRNSKSTWREKPVKEWMSSSFSTALAIQ